MNREFYLSIQNSINHNFPQYHYPNFISTFGDSNAIMEVDVTVPAITNEQKSKIWWYPYAEIMLLEGKSLGLLRNIIVHGSYGDFSFINYSDLDITLFIEDKCIQDKTEINKLQKWINQRFYPFMLSVDPLQHHGPFYLCNFISQNYSECILPIDVYRKCWSFNNQVIPFRIHKSPISQDYPKRLSMITCGSLDSAHSSFFKYGYNMYSMKRYLSNIMILPTLYLADQGIFLHKGHSFIPFYERFAHAADPIRLASEIRLKWPKSPSWIKKLTERTQFLSKGCTPSKIAKMTYYNFKIRKKIIKIEAKMHYLCNILKESFH